MLNFKQPKGRRTDGSLGDHLNIKTNHSTPNKRKKQKKEPREYVICNIAPLHPMFKEEPPSILKTNEKRNKIVNEAVTPEYRNKI